MTWSRDQVRALKEVDRWLRDPDRQVFRLFGYAGTGKTTLAQEISTRCSSAHFCAFTGKAADVMRQRGCEPVSTIHKLIYRAIENQAGRVEFKLRPQDELDLISLIVVDEASMVDQYLARDLLSYGIPTLIIIDPFQLPSINGGSFFAHAKPDAMLTEIHRQAADNPILALADQIRRGQPLPRPGYHVGGVLRVTNGADPAHDDPDDFDVVLVGLNTTRQRRNRQMRRGYGFIHGSQCSPPQLDEVVVCLRNDYYVTEPVFNGSTWSITSITPIGNAKLPILQLGLIDEDTRTSTVRVPLECFTENEFRYYPGLQQFDFGYALTVHKAQGSEWDNVLLVNESRHFQPDAARWLYTGITRARTRLTVVDYT